MLGPDALPHAHQAAIDVERVNLPKRREHGPEFKPDEAVSHRAEFRVSGHDAVVVLLREPVALEDDGRAGVLLNHRHLPRVGIEVERRAGLVGDERAGNVAAAGAFGLGDGQRTALGGVVDEVAEAGVHVHRRAEARLHRAAHMRGETGPVHLAVGEEREENGGEALDASPWTQQLDGIRR